MQDVLVPCNGKVTPKRNVVKVWLTFIYKTLYTNILMRATQKGTFCVALDSKVFMYTSTLRFSNLRKC